jgi:hypothetical protein
MASGKVAIGRGTLAGWVVVVVLAASVAFVALSSGLPGGTVTRTTTVSNEGSAATQTVTTTDYAFPGYIFLSASGICAGSGGYDPCWGGSAYVFDCAGAAATQQGCAQQVVTTLSTQLSPLPSYVVNIRFPFYNQSVPSWTNCLWTVAGTSPGQGYAYCALVNSTSDFIMGIQSPPHP